jgi:flagellar hook-basal body complex protein FliE
MEVPPIQALSSVAPASAPAAAPAPGVARTGASNFSELLEQALGEADRLQKDADRAVAGLATGELQDIHEVVLSLAKADLSFRMMVEVRNRVLEAYQEVMRTPV